MNDNQKDKSPTSSPVVISVPTSSGSPSAPANGGATPAGVINMGAPKPAAPPTAPIALGNINKPSSPMPSPVPTPSSLSSGNNPANIGFSATPPAPRPAMNPTMPSAMPVLPPSNPAQANPMSTSHAPMPTQPTVAGKDFQALMKEMQNINQSRGPAAPAAGPVAGGLMNLGSPVAPQSQPGLSQAAAPKVYAAKNDSTALSTGDDDGYYGDDYYGAPPPMSPMMKLFFAMQTLVSIIMVVLLVMIFNMFSSMKNQSITADSMKNVLQSFVDGIANQNKALMDSFATKMDEVEKTIATMNEGATKTQEALDTISKKLDKAISRPPVAAPAKPVVKKKAAPAIEDSLPTPMSPVGPTNNNMPALPNNPNISPNLPGLDNLNDLPNLPPLPTVPQSKAPGGTIGGQPNQQVKFGPNNYNDSFQLPPLPEPTPNLFPNN